MKMKIIVILLLVVTIALAGCAEEDKKSNGANVTPTSDNNESVVEDGGSAATPEDYEPMDYPIRLKNYKAITANPLEINRTDTVTWINQQNEPKRFFTIKNEEGMWDDVTLGYMQKFTYQFNETGEYHTYIPPWSTMNVTIIVK
ncbi:hypothetical protein [Methanohalophilus sp.]|uniref:hypothetical protein n=1 Tax=Methanohalophilus sp. TaxID=1966352 RepID=UPI002639DCEA|nr:hypothetical protein [Methanohalophilus sp.]MDK2892191.1 hypothetical protein [Methanohalophilus sp.]